VETAKFVGLGAGIGAVHDPQHQVDAQHDIADGDVDGRITVS
jgi:hypothetical protein